ncbi:MAG: hypothetical protein AAGA27_00070 [Pseudomonadota bacterium]
MILNITYELKYLQEALNFLKIYHDFIFNSSNKGLKLLHDIVTLQKHARVTEKTHPNEDIAPSTKYKGGEILTLNDGTQITTNKSIQIFLENIEQ